MKKVLSMILAIALLLCMFSACGNTAAESAESAENAVSAAAETETEAAAAEEPAQAAEAADAAEASAEEPVTLESDGLEVVELPLVEDGESLSFWLPYPFFVGNMVEDMAEDVSVLKELAARTGITMEITAINGEAEEEQFNLMIASGNYCDVITDMSKYSLGYDSAIEEDVIIDLYDLVQEYAPNYWYYLTQDINTLATLVTDNGNLPCVATLYATAGAENAGYVVRQDWLDELGMSTPTTYDELAAYVEAANNTYGAQGMYLGSDGNDALFSFGFDCGSDYIVVDGEVQHSFQQDSFRTYLETAADWYSRGLIFNDFYLYGQDDTEDQMFCSGGLAVNVGRCTSYDLFYGYTDESYSAVYAPMNPVRVNADDQIHYSGTTGSLIKKADTWSITESCSDPELVMELVNYLFSEEGQLLFNWGVEGEAYTLNADGEPEYTDMMINDPDMAYLFTAYLYASNTASEYAPSIMDVSKQYYSFDDTAWDAYYLYLDDGADGSYNYPDGATLTADELTEYATYSSDVDTYVDTQLLAFITGQVVLDDASWADFQSNLESLGINEMVEAKQAAYDRYAEKLAGLNA